jgi:hypothetical protein
MLKLKIVEEGSPKSFILTDESGAIYGRYADKEEACARKADWEEYLNSPISAEGD